MLERSVQKKLVKGCARKSAYSINKFQNKSKWKASFSSDFGDFHYCIFSVLYCGPHLEQQVIGAERKFDGMSCWPNLHTTWALGQCNVATAFVLFYSLSSTTSRSADASDNICKTPFWPLRKCGKEKKKGIWSLHYLGPDQCWQVQRTSDCCHLSTMSSCAT